MFDVWTTCAAPGRAVSVHTFPDSAIKSYPVKCEHSCSNCDRFLVLFPSVCKHVCKNKLIVIRLWEIDIRSVSQILDLVTSFWHVVCLCFRQRDHLINANQSEFYCQSLFKMLAQALYRRESPLWRDWHIRLDNQARQALYRRESPLWRDWHIRLDNQARQKSGHKQVNRTGYCEILSLKYFSSSAFPQVFFWRLALFSIDF